MRFVFYFVVFMYCSLDILIGKLRGGEEDEYNLVGVVILIGMIFKSIVGLRFIIIVGGLGVGIAIVYYFGEKFWNSRGYLILIFNWV